MNNKSFVRKLDRMEACEEAVEWVKSHGGTSAECWQDCVRGDWMAWLAASDAKKLGITKRQLVGALADCAALSLKYYEAEYPDDKRVRECINTCRRYAKGKATDKELAEASSTSYASTSYAATNANAAANAANAANAAATAANAATAAASTSYAATAAYYAAASTSYAAYDAITKALKQCAGIFRKHFPEMSA